MHFKLLLFVCVSFYTNKYTNKFKLKVAWPHSTNHMPGFRRFSRYSRPRLYFVPSSNYNHVRPHKTFLLSSWPGEDAHFQLWSDEVLIESPPVFNETKNNTLFSTGISYTRISLKYTITQGNTLVKLIIIQSVTGRPNEDKSQRRRNSSIKDSSQSKINKHLIQTIAIDRVSNLMKST